MKDKLLIFSIKKKIYRTLRFTLYALRFHEAGFTLIEMLIVIGVFGLISGITLTILVNTLRSSNKTNLINTIRQNGNYALDQMSRTIRTAVNIQSPALPCNASASPTTSSTLTVVASDGTVSSFVCTGTNPPSPTPANALTLNGNSLMDTNTTYVTSCTFTCSQESVSDTPVIGIDFFVRDNNNSGFYEQSISPIEFKSSIIMQNVGHQ